MNILDLLAERRSKQQYMINKNEAQEIFDKQKEAIKGIKNKQ
jgi:hypothetical protein